MRSLAGHGAGRREADRESEGAPTSPPPTPSDTTRTPSTNDSMTEDPVTTTGTPITVTTLHEILTDSVLLPVISTAELT